MLLKRITSLFLPLALAFTPTTTNFNYNSSYQTYTCEGGVYEIECAGAQGGKYNANAGSLGANAKMKIKLKKDDVLYIYTGSTSGANPLGSNYAGASGGSYGAAGGGATVVTKSDGTVLLAAAGGGGANKDYYGIDKHLYGAGSVGGGGGGYTSGKSGKLSGNLKSLISGLEWKSDAGYGWYIWNDIDSSISGDDSYVKLTATNNEYDWVEFSDRDGRRGDVSGSYPSGAYRFAAYSYTSHGVDYHLDTGWFDSTVSGTGVRTFDYMLGLSGQTSISSFGFSSLSDLFENESIGLWSLASTYFSVYTDLGLLQRVTLADLAANDWQYEGISCSFSRDYCYMHAALNEYNNGTLDHPQAPKWNSYDQYNSCGLRINVGIHVSGLSLPVDSSKIRIVFHGKRLKPQQVYESDMVLKSMYLLWGGYGGSAGESYNDSVGYDFVETRESNSGNGWAKITWLEPGNYTVTLDKDDGVLSVSGAGEYEADTNVSIGATLKTGYEFVRWETSTIGFSNSTSNPYTFSLTDDVKYNAISAAKKYTLNFDYNKPPNASSNITGNGTTSKIVTYDSTVGTLPSPSLTGWTFDGWILKGTALTNDTVWGYDEDGLTAVASWTPHKYDVLYKKGITGQ